MPVGAMPVSLVVKPETFVDIAIGMDQNSLSVGLIVLPHAFVSGRVGPNLYSTAMLLSIDALTRVGASIGVLGRSLIQLVIIRFDVSASSAILTSLAFGVRATNALLICLIAIFDLELLSLLIDVNLVLIVTLILFNSDLAFGVGARIRDAITCTVSHFISWSTIIFRSFFLQSGQM